ncbi:MAG: sodium:solute symporter [Phycisphaeraceae bacterium]
MNQRLTLCLCFVVGMAIVGMPALAQTNRSIDIQDLHDTPMGLIATQAVWLNDGLVALVESSDQASLFYWLPDSAEADMLVQMRMSQPAMVRAEGGALVIGGYEQKKWLRSVQSVVLEDSTPVITLAGDLPLTLENPLAVALRDRVYVVGLDHDTQTSKLISLRVENGTAIDFREHASPPLALSGQAKLVTQAAGERQHLYLLTHDKNQHWHLMAYDPNTDQWLSRESPTISGPSRLLVPFGAHSLILTTKKAIGSGQAYNTITNRWSSMNIQGLDQPLISVDDSHRSLVWFMPEHPDNTGRITEIRPANLPSNFGWLDYTTLALYLLALVGLGAYFSRRENSTEQYFLAGRNIPWWAAALSLMATQVSSIGFIAVPAKTFATDWIYFAGILSWFVVVPVVTRVHIPFFRRLKVTSAYEYLEARFDVNIRLFAALTFSLLQLGRMAVVLYLPALVLSVVTGIPIITCILIMGVLATAYTVAGGMEAVIWTDVLQAGLLLLGAVLCVVVAIAGIEGGLTEAVSLANADDKLRLVNTDSSFMVSALWVILLGSIFSRFSNISADQSVIQRYLTTTDEKQAGRALWGDVAVSIPWAIIAFGMGTAIFVFYQANPDHLAPGLRADAVVPFFISQQLPTGLSGLIIAGIFAAAMSSLDSAIHSVSTVLTTDVYQRVRPEGSDRVRLRLARGLTILLGAFGTGIALLMTTAEILSIWDLFIEVIGLFVGMLAGLFVLGMFTTRSNGTGALLGAILGAASLYLVKQHTAMHFYLFPVVGIVVCVASGYLLSLILPGRSTTQDLTIHTMPKDLTQSASQS